MTLAEAYTLFARRAERRILEGIKGGWRDEWPLACTTGAFIGGINDAQTDEDLDAAIDRYANAKVEGSGPTREEGRQITASVWRELSFLIRSAPSMN